MPAGALVTSVNTALAQVQSGSREPDHSIRFLFRSALLRVPLLSFAQPVQVSSAPYCITAAIAIAPSPNEAQVGS